MVLSKIQVSDPGPCWPSCCMFVFFLFDFLTLSQTIPGFYVSAARVFFKTLREKEKLLVTSNFSFSRSVFYPLGGLPAIFIRFEIVVCKPFQFGRVQNLSFGKGLINDICRKIIKIWKSPKLVVWERIN